MASSSVLCSAFGVWAPGASALGAGALECLVLWSPGACGGSFVQFDALEVLAQ
jgi:hypothetical protein